METPIIGVVFDFDSDTFELTATSYGRTAPAGPRLFRGGDFPLINFAHADEAAARREALLLQRYLNDIGAKRAPSKQKIREHAAD